MVLHMLYEHIHDSGSCGIPRQTEPFVTCGRFRVPGPIEKKFSNRRAVYCCRSAAISLSRLHVGATYAGGLPTLPGTRFLPVAPGDGLARGYVELVVSSLVRTVPSSTVAIVRTDARRQGGRICLRAENNAFDAAVPNVLHVTACERNGLPSCECCVSDCRSKQNDTPAFLVTGRCVRDRGFPPQSARCG
jgi:hypothetical protein